MYARIYPSIHLPQETFKLRGNFRTQCTQRRCGNISAFLPSAFPTITFIRRNVNYLSEYLNFLLTFIHTFIKKLLFCRKNHYFVEKSILLNFKFK